MSFLRYTRGLNEGTKLKAKAKGKAKQWDVELQRSFKKQSVPWLDSIDRLGGALLLIRR